MTTVATHIFYRYNNFLFWISALSTHSAFHTDCSAPCRVLSCAPTAPALPPDNPALSFYIPRSDCGLYYCFLLSALINTPRLSDFALPYPFRIGLFTPRFYSQRQKFFPFVVGCADFCCVQTQIYLAKIVRIPRRGYSKRQLFLSFTIAHSRTITFCSMNLSVKCLICFLFSVQFDGRLLPLLCKLYAFDSQIFYHFFQFLHKR